MAAYGKTELWQAARAVDVEDFDFKHMAPSQAFWPRKARRDEISPRMLAIVTTRMH